MILRARVVLPLIRAPIQDGAVLIYGNRVARVGRWKDLSGDDRDEVFDLGNVVLLWRLRICCSIFFVTRSIAA